MILSIEELDNNNYAINNTIEEKYKAIDQKLNDVGYSINNHERESKERDLGINGHIDQSQEVVVNKIKNIENHIYCIQPTITQIHLNTDHIIKHLNTHLILLILLGVVSVSSLVFDIILLCLME